MRLKDISVGMEVYTRVSGRRVRVRVVEITTRLNMSGRRSPKIFVARLSKGTRLPTPRSPQALHVTNGRGGEWPSMTEKQDRPTPQTWSDELLEARNQNDADRAALEKAMNLPAGTESGNLEMVDLKDGTAVTLSITHRVDGEWELLAEWGPGPHGPFRIARTFTQKQYAADWVRAHLRVAR